jgi:hypothetical protein
LPFENVLQELLAPWILKLNQLFGLFLCLGQTATHDRWRSHIEMRETDPSRAMTRLEGNGGFKGFADFGSEHRLHPKRRLAGFFPIAAAQTKMVGRYVGIDIDRCLTMGNGFIHISRVQIDAAEISMRGGVVRVTR